MSKRSVTKPSWLDVSVQPRGIRLERSPWKDGMYYLETRKPRVTLVLDERIVLKLHAALHRELELGTDGPVGPSAEKGGARPLAPGGGGGGGSIGSPYFKA